LARQRAVLALGLALGLLVPILGCAPVTPAAKPSAAAHTATQVQAVRFLLDFVLDGTHTPYLAARDRGWYREVGLDVELTPGTGSFDTVKLVGAGQAPLGYADAGAMALGIVQDVPVTMVAAMYQQSPLAIFSLSDRNISQPRDLEGKSIGIASGAAEAKILPAFVKKNNLDASRIAVVDLSIPTRIPTLVAGNVDALAGFIVIQGDIASQTATGVNVIKFADHGIQMYGNGIIANTDFAARNPAVVERFLQATMRGLKFALDDPAQALESTYKALPDRDRGLLAERWRLAAQLMQSETTRRQGLGQMDEATWKATQDLMVEYGGQTRAVELSKLYTNKFLKTTGS
jgi:NitT/TauT family transport system substrate-binding protein